MIKHISIWSVSVALVASATHGGPDIERLAPEDSVVVVAVGNAQKSLERLKATGLWDLWESDQVQAMRSQITEMAPDALEDLLDEIGIDPDDLALPDGPVGMAFFPVTDDDLTTTGGFLLVADYGANGDKMNRIVDAALENAEDEAGVEFDRSDILGRTVLTIELAQLEDAAGDLDAMPRDPFGGNMPDFASAEAMSGLEKLHFVRDGNLFLLASHLEPLGEALETIDGDGDIPGIGTREDFRGVMRQIGTSDAYAVVLTRGIAELVSGGDPMSMMIEDMARTIIGDIRGVGVGVRIDAPGAMIRERLAVYMPNGRSGLTALLDTETPRDRIPSFAGPHVISYSAFNFEFDGLVDLIRTIGQINPMAQQQLDMFLAEYGEEIERVTSVLGPEVHNVSTVRKPIRMDSVKSATAVRCRQPAEVEQVLVKYAGGWLEARDFLGHRIYSVPMNAMNFIGGPMMGPQNDGFSIGFGAGYVFLGTTSQVEDCLRASGRDDLPALADNPAYKRALRALRSGDSVAWGVTDIVEYVEFIKNIDLLIQEQMIEQMKMWNPEYADELRAQMADQPPPPWRDLDVDVIRRHIGPAAWDVRVNDDGFVANFSLLEAE